MACHYMDLPFWALGLRHPDSAEAEGPEVHPETCPLGLIVRYNFPESNPGKAAGAVKLTWYDGNKIPKTVAGERVPGSGVMFVGKEGKMFANYGQLQALSHRQIRRTTNRPSKQFRSRSAITPSGSKPARKARPRFAISIIRAP